MPIDITITTKGPFFYLDGGYWHRVIKDYGNHLEQVLGDKGVAWIRVLLVAQYQYLRNPASLGYHGNKNHFVPGLYQSVIHTVTVADAVLIHDTPCVYGPWLEGVGSRNSPVTRFPGYHTFRKITQVLDRSATDIGYSELGPYIAELNG